MNTQSPKSRLLPAGEAIASHGEPLRLDGRAIGLALVAALFLAPDSASGQTNWVTEVDELDDFPTDLTDLNSLQIGNIYDEGTRDLVLRTSDGMVLAYGVGRYRHHTATANLGATVDVRLAPSGVGLPDTVVTCEAGQVQRWFGDAQSLAAGSAFATSEFLDGLVVRTWKGGAGLDVVAVIDRDSSETRRALFYLAEDPSVSRYQSYAPVDKPLPIGSDPEQTLFSDLSSGGLPLLILLNGRKLTVVPVFGSDPAWTCNSNLSGGRFCPNDQPTSSAPLYFVGHDGTQWLGCTFDGNVFGNCTAIAPYTPSMAPLRGLEFVELTGDSSTELVLSFDDRVLITNLDSASQPDQWLPSGSVNAPTSYSNSSPAVITDIDGDDDLDIVVAYGNDASTPAQIVVHEDSAGDPAPTLHGLSYGSDPRTGLVELTVETAASSDWDQIEVILYDVPLTGPDAEEGAPLNWERIPELESVALDRGYLDDGTAVTGGNWQLKLSIPPPFGIVDVGDSAPDHLALLELRGRNISGEASPQQPQLGPSNFYVLDAGGTGFLPVESDFDDPGVTVPAWFHDDPAPVLPHDVRPSAQIPAVRRISHRPPKRGPRPNPDPQSGQ